MNRRRKLKPKTYELEIETLSHEGRGIAHLEEKVIFVSGALLGEKVVAERVFSRAKFEEAEVLKVLEPLWGQAWGYRCKTRLEVCWVAKKNKVLVSFRKKKSGWVAKYGQV